MKIALIVLLGMATGDVIVVPAGMPHWYKDLDGPITYLEVRWDEK